MGLKKFVHANACLLPMPSKERMNDATKESTYITAKGRRIDLTFFITAAL